MSATTEIGTARTLLFVPGDRVDRFAKALGAGADLVVFDLEDAVSADAKAAARESVARAVDAADVPVAVRINAVGTPWHAQDVARLAGTSAHIMLPKVESSADVDGLGLDADDSRRVIALIETPRGVANAVEIATTPNVERLAFGSLDFAAALGISPDDRTALMFARAQLVLASGVGGFNGPIDGVTANVRDPAAVTDDMRYANALGFTGKLCIHPAQLAATEDALRPSDADVEWARGIVAAADASGFSEGGVVAVDGRMVDAPVVKRAERIMAHFDDCSASESRVLGESL